MTSIEKTPIIREKEITLAYAKYKTIISQVPCACGCGEEVEIFYYQTVPSWIKKYGNLRYINGHNWKGKKQSKESLEKRVMKLRKRIKANCDNCGKELEIVPFVKKTLKHHFCNRICLREWQDKTDWWHNRSFNLTEKGREVLSEQMKGEKNPRYKTWQKLSEKEKEQWLKEMRTSQEKRPTNPERKLIKIIELFNLPFRYTGNGSFWLGRINPDFICRIKRIIIEVFGDYWHNRPEIKVRDEKKNLLIQKYGWERIVIWEKNLNTLAPEQIAYELMKRIKEVKCFATTK